MLHRGRQPVFAAVEVCKEEALGRTTQMLLKRGQTFGSDNGYQLCILS